MSNRSPSSQLFEHHRTSLEKLDYISPMDIAASTFSSFFQQCRGCLSKSEAKQVYREAKSYRQQLQAKTRKVLTHSNPQLKQVPHLAIDPLQQASLDYEVLFGQRADAYVSESSVASMFSPAAYLTELYREGKQLHTSDQPQYLDKRRPDLKSLSLSQSNLDTEVTTLALSNEILSNTIQNRTDKDANEVYEALDYAAYPFDLPYHKPFTSIETALTTQNSSFEALAQALAPSQKAGAFPTNIRAAYANHLSPGLRRLLLEPIPSESEEADLNSALLRHFGTADIEQLSDVEYFCQRVGISQDELNNYLGLPIFEQASGSVDYYSRIAHTPRPTPLNEYGGQYLAISECFGSQDDGGSGTIVGVNSLGKLVKRAFTYTLFDDGSQINDFSILPSNVAEHVIFSVSSALDDSEGCIDIYINYEPVLSQDDSVPRAYCYFNVTTDIESVSELEFRVARGGYNYQAATTVSFDEPTNLSKRQFISLSNLIRYCQKSPLSPAALSNLIQLSSIDDSQPHISEETLQLTARTLEYQKRYALSEDDALVLAGADINVYAQSGKLSQFDLLFNNPPLNDITFTTYGTISFALDDTTHVQERSVLKRALGVDDAGLVTLAAIVDHDDFSWPRSLDNLSALYRVGLWARVHNLTPQELQLLLQLNGKTEYPRGYTSLADYLDAIYSTNQWLVAQQLSVAELNVMTTNAYPETMTPEIDSLVRTLYQVVKEGKWGERLKWPVCLRTPPSQAKT